MEYQLLVKTYGDEAAAIPTMNIFTVKKDKESNPIQEKSRIVVLENHEKRIWLREDQYVKQEVPRSEERRVARITKSHKFSFPIDR